MRPETGCGRLQISEIRDILSFISPDFAIVDSNSVCGALHLNQAAELSLLAHEGGYNLSKDKSTEVLLYLTGQRQISKALKLAGINQSTESVAWVSFSKFPKDFLRIVEIDKEVISPSKFSFSRFDVDQDLSLEIKQKIIITKTAILSVQSR